MLKSITQVNQNDKQISKTVKRFFIMQEISRSDISGITTKAPCEVALMGERHVRIEISDFVMRTFVPTGTTVLQGGIKNACNVLTCMDTAGAYFAAVKCKKAGTKPEYRAIFG